MNCRICVSQKVCFVQKQIDHLAERMTRPPFCKRIDISAERTSGMIVRWENKMEKCDNLECTLKGVIASNCPLFEEESE